MATFIANRQINMPAFNYGDFVGSATNLVFGKTQIVVDFANGDRHLFDGKFGINILARMVSGSASHWLYSNGPDTIFEISNAKIDAAKLVKAGMTATFADDQAAMADIFKTNDFIKGSAFADVLFGYKGNDTIAATAGDTVNGGDAKDKDTITFADVTGGVGVQLALTKGVVSTFNIGGTLGNVVFVEHVTGSSFGDSITGDVDANILNGDGGDDYLDGSVGNDTINGGIGNDTIVGGAGKDFLNGGADADVFKYLSVADAPKGEIISDFQPGIDKIDLSAIDAMMAASPGVDDAFTFDAVMGSAKSAVAQGHVSWYKIDKAGDANDRTFVLVNVDADTKPNMIIEIKGAWDLTAGDFIL